MTLTFKFDLLLNNFNHGFYLVMVAARRALMSSDNSYFFIVTLKTNKARCTHWHIFAEFDESSLNGLALIIFTGVSRYMQQFGLSYSCGYISFCSL